MYKLIALISVAAAAGELTGCQQCCSPGGDCSKAFKGQPVSPPPREAQTARLPRRDRSPAPALSMRSSAMLSVCLRFTGHLLRPSRGQLFLLP